MNSFITKIIQKFYAVNETFNFNKELIKNTVESYYLTEEEDTEPNSELDNVKQGKSFSGETFLQTNTPIIYAFITKYAPDAIKIGYTTQGPEQRIDQWRKHYSDAKLLGYWTATELNKSMQRVFFMDYPVHDRTVRRGYKNLLDDPDALNEFKRLAKEDKIEDIHVSKEFFMKYKNMSEKNIEDELTTTVIDEIINEIKMIFVMINQLVSYFH